MTTTPTKGRELYCRVCREKYELPPHRFDGDCPACKLVCPSCEAADKADKAARS